MISLTSCADPIQIDSPSFDISCDAIEDTVQWIDIYDQLPRDFRETSRTLRTDNILELRGYPNRDLFNGNVGDVHKQLVSIQINLDNLNVRSDLENVKFEFDLPCDKCQAQIIDQSPKKQHFLVKIQGEAYGVWLINHFQSIRVLDRVPPDYSWSWSDDESMLFISYALEGVGKTFSIVNQLNSKYTITEFSEIANMSAGQINQEYLNLFYTFTYNPANKQVWWFKRFASKVNVYDTINRTNDSQIIEDFSDVEWQALLDRIVLIHYKNGSVQINSVDGNYTITIPQELVMQVYAPFENENHLAANIMDRRVYLNQNGLNLYIDANGLIYKLACHQEQ